jgi:hypothetical protein
MTGARSDRSVWTILSSLFLFSSVLFSQELPELIPYYKAGKWGYANPYRNLVLPPVFDEAEMFEEGVAKVKLNGKTKWIDLKGLDAVPPMNADQSRKAGYKIFFKNDKYGVSDRMGKVLVEADYESIKHGAVGKDGSPDYSKAILLVKSKKKYGFIDKTGKVLVPIQHDECKMFSEGFCWAKKDGKWAAFTAQGKQITSYIYDDVDDFHEGLSVVSKKGTDKEMKMGVIDAKGKEIIELKYKAISSFSNGLAAVLLDSAYGYMNQEGKEVIEMKYDEAYGFDLDSGRYAMVKDSGKVGIIDQQGTMILKCEYNRILGVSQGLFLAEKDGKKGFVDITGNVVVPFTLDDAKPFSGDYAPAMMGGLWGIIGKNGSTIIPYKYNGSMRVECPGLFAWTDEGGTLNGYVDFYGNEFFER